METLLRVLPAGAAESDKPELRQDSLHAIVGPSVGPDTVSSEDEAAGPAGPDESDVVPLSVIQSDDLRELEVGALLGEQVHHHPAVVGLHQHPLVDGVELVVHGVESEVGSRLSGRVELDPHGDGKLLGAESEWNDQGGGGGLALVSEVEVVVDGDGFATVLSGQVEGAAAVEVAGEVDAGGGGRADAGLAVVDVLLAVDARVALGAHALVGGAVVHAGGAVLADALRARVELVLAADARVGGGAGAVEAGAEVAAEAAVQAGRADAPLRRSLAPLAVRSLGAPG